MSEGFLLGPDLLARTRRTIETVEGGVFGSGFRAIPTVLEGETPAQTRGTVLQIGTFVGSWFKASNKIVTLATGGTVLATNSVLNIVGNGRVRSCVIAKVGDGFSLISAEC